MSIFFAILIAVYMPGQRKQDQKKDDDATGNLLEEGGDDDTQKTDKDKDSEGSGMTPDLVRSIIVTAICAGVLDSLGDEGNKFARTTIMVSM